MPVTRPKKKIARKSPKHRPNHGAHAWGHIRNGDESKHYVAVNIADQEGGVGYYSEMGYVPEVLSDAPDALGWKGGITVKPGEQITNRGHLLMSIDKEKHADIVQYGPDGNTGQEAADDNEQRMVDRRGTDYMRGLHGNGFEAEGGFGEDTE